jgi:hypothetical protein
VSVSSSSTGGAAGGVLAPGAQRHEMLAEARPEDRVDTVEQWRARAVVRRQHARRGRPRALAKRSRKIVTSAWRKA